MNKENLTSILFKIPHLIVNAMVIIFIIGLIASFIYSFFTNFWPEEQLTQVKMIINIIAWIFMFICFVYSSIWVLKKQQH